LYDAVFTYDDLTFRVYLSVKTAVNPHGSFDPDFSLEMHALRQERDIVVATKSILFHAVPPSSPPSLHHSNQKP
jgi:hypothetical protein